LSTNKVEVDKWAWDREHIKKYREKYEPMDPSEAGRFDVFNRNPWALETWIGDGKDIDRKELPSGLVVITKIRDGRWEQVVLTDKGECLNFTHEPKVEYKPVPPLTPEQIEFVIKKWKDPEAREQRRRELFGPRIF
jgi:hypothetical protein